MGAAVRIKQYWPDRSLTRAGVSFEKRWHSGVQTDGGRPVLCQPIAVSRAAITRAVWIVC